MFDFNSKGTQMMVKSLLTMVGADKQKIDAALDAVTATAQKAQHAIGVICQSVERIEAKIDSLIGRTEPKDNESATLYLENGKGDIEPITGSVGDVLSNA